ncbi:hypothetical protein EDD29_7276 [Actinocorallia herbida]|uniref:Uncharacterized protein n=1 Tax=Actinocorallia herbida TaxID=58109 RepID=A0A3N1D7R1_9ACTN|nr:hypothetical protein [Actinocorallia herbida]ROO89577.1 hypothetical protein EDD29_7276 [Actinocorallia herbida]
MHLHSLDGWNMRCPCGARNERIYGLCRKCAARAVWRRRKARRSWRSRLASRVERTFELTGGA